MSCSETSLSKELKKFYYKTGCIFVQKIYKCTNGVPLIKSEIECRMLGMPTAVEVTVFIERMSRSLGDTSGHKMQIRVSFFNELLTGAADLKPRMSLLKSLSILYIVLKTLLMTVIKR
jgi:hypothetical protein